MLLLKKRKQESLVKILKKDINYIMKKKGTCIAAYDGAPIDYICGLPSKGGVLRRHDHDHETQNVVYVPIFVSNQTYEPSVVVTQTTEQSDTANVYKENSVLRKLLQEIIAQSDTNNM